MPVETPVAFFVFNRPEQTRRVFAEIAKARPRTLLIVADGPREGHPTDAERCAAVRELLETIDWECTVERDYSGPNLGCRRRVSSGLDWVFSRCERAIILEDDCLPHPSFFGYCEELLDRYAEDERVMMVSGDCFLPDGRSPYSYRFSRYNLIWGWASWRRAWRHYDPAISLWPSLRDTGWLLDVTGSPTTAAYWRDVFDRVHAGGIDTWDYQWMFASWSQNGVAIVPEVNLVSNIGFGAEATHTTGDSLLADRPVAAMDLPLRHPPYVIRDPEADRRLADEVFGWRLPAPLGLGARLRRRLAAATPSPVKSLVRRSLASLLPGSPRGMGRAS